VRQRSVVRIVESWRLQWARNVKQIMCTEYYWEMSWRTSSGRPWRLGDNIKIDFGETGLLRVEYGLN
jgi:hypothetical protein